MILFVLDGVSQNLVPNYSFEKYSICPGPGIGGDMTKVDDWFDGCPGDADYYNKCAVYYPSPFNAFHGRIFSMSDSACCGMFVFQDSSGSSSDYIETALTQPLLFGKSYRFACKLRPSKNYRSADAIDFYFSSSLLSSPDSCFYFVTPQVSNPVGNIISDSLNWYVLIDTFIAVGGENYLTIGSFRSGAVTNTLPGASGDPRAYMFIDSVSVVMLDTTGLIETENQFYFSIYPNPSNDYIFIESKIQNANFILTDVTGRELMQFKLLENRTQLNLGDLPSGVYFVTNNRFCRKIVVQH